MATYTVPPVAQPLTLIQNDFPELRSSVEDFHKNEVPSLRCEAIHEDARPSHRVAGNFPRYARAILNGVPSGVVENETKYAITELGKFIVHSWERVQRVPSGGSGCRQEGGEITRVLVECCESSTIFPYESPKGVTWLQRGRERKILYHPIWILRRGR